MKKILISACLVRENVRYNAQVFEFENNIILEWQKQNILISFCPEVASGLPIPRNPVEIVNLDRLDDGKKEKKIIDQAGNNYADQFNLGARKAWEVIQEHNISMAILKERSPSCGSQLVYDGTFTGTIIPGSGITAEFLLNRGIKVFNENQIEEAYALWCCK